MQLSIAISHQLNKFNIYLSYISYTKSYFIEKKTNK